MSDRGHVPSSASADPRPGESGHAGGVMTGGVEHLDFGVRNTLLYYKDLKATLDLTPGSGANPDAVARLLGAQAVPVSEIFGAGPDSLKGAVKRVRSISYRARREVEKGTPGTLCVAWGLATWNNGRTTVPAAPIVLRQASVVRHQGTADDFDLAVTGPWNLNMTLLRLLEIDFGIDVERDVLHDLAEELSGHGDPDPLFERVTKMAHDVPGFSIARRVVLAPVPRVAMVVPREVSSTTPPPPDPAGAAYPDRQVTAPAGVVAPAEAPAPAETASGPAEAPAPALALPAEVTVPEAVALASVDAREGDGEATADVVELFRSGALNPKTMAEGSFERRIVERLGPDAVIADITATLRGDGWPEALVEHADSGLRVRERAELLQRWFESSEHRPRPSGWDATHFALWGLAAAPPVGNPAIRSVARWGERRHHPILVAWQLVAERRAHGHHRGRHGARRVLATRRVTIPKGIDAALWGLPVDLLVEWATWVFKLWPGAPIEYVLPAGTPELVSAWYDRARPVAELAVKTWIPFSGVDDELGRAAHRWVKHLTNACAGGGSPLATWFERSAAVATEAVALRLGDTGAGGRRIGRRTTVAHAEHAI